MGFTSYGSSSSLLEPPKGQGLELEPEETTRSRVLVFHSAYSGLGVRQELILGGRGSDDFVALPRSYPNKRPPEENAMAGLYTFDVYSSLDGFGSYEEPGDWGGYWGKQGPEFLQHRLDLVSSPQQMVFGAKTFQQFAEMLTAATVESGIGDPWVATMRNLPTTVVSSTMESSLGWPDATIEKGDAIDVVARLKAESDIPMRSHGSLSMNRALMAAGLVDRVQVTVFPVITGKTGSDPIFKGADDFDLELIESRVFDGHIQELTYRPTLH